ncbi:MAG TPA: MBL fold metallo-hydrolase [Gammaproteobacteria bacterium]|nr:MBL fold metallo-hydrolase [Gammaproteobacteria bacterium]
MSLSVKYLLDFTPKAGEFLEVVEGIYLLRMPLPMQLDHINLWLLRDHDDWVLVDTGLFFPESVAVWEKIACDLIAPGQLKRIVATHFHPDHIGMAGWLADTWGAELIMTRGEWLQGRLRQLDVTPETQASEVDFFVKAGLFKRDDPQNKTYASRYQDQTSAIPRVFRRIESGDTIEINGEDWEVITGGGHSPEHACLYSNKRDILISGDQLLPRITSIISVFGAEPDSNPLSVYYASLKNLRQLPEDTIVLPAHGLPFERLRERVDYILAHHDERLELLINNLESGKRAVDLLGTLFDRELDFFQSTFATGETIAHLNYLIHQGQVMREENEKGEWVYTRT